MKNRIKKAIIVAAGGANRLRPITNEKPKCMLEIGGKTILERLLQTFRGAGIDKINLVRGYLKEKINYPDIEYFDKPDLKVNSILLDLFCAEKAMSDGFIFSYGDIIYGEKILDKLLKSKKPISLVIDVNWKNNYKNRKKHPISEAELVFVEKGKITKIKKGLDSKKAYGEFIGLAKFSKKGAEILKKEFEEIKRKYLDKPFQDAPIFQKAYLTDMIQELIERGYDVYPVDIKEGWSEIDTDEDLKKARKKWK